jgi:hypothetical protein
MQKSMTEMMMHVRYEGDNEHSAPLLDAPRQQHERDATSDDALWIGVQE